MNQLNLSLLEGHLAHEPELFYTKQGYTLCKFRVACQKNKSHEGEVITKNEYFLVYTWGKLAEICNQYLKKESKVRVRGTLTQETWTDRNGDEKERVIITAEYVDFLKENETQEEPVI